MSPVSDDQWLRQIGVDVNPDGDGTADAGNGLVAELDESDPVGDDEGRDAEEDRPDATPAAGDGGLFGRAPEPEQEPESAEGEESSSAGKDTRLRRFTPWVLGVFAAVAVVATAATTLGVLVSGPDTPPARVHTPRTTPAPSLAAAPTTAPPDTEDRPLPFTARADCAGGSTSANSVADPDRPSPWICVRHTDGQPLYITLGPAGIEHSYVITAVSIIPGDTAPAQGSGGDPWLQHRVVSLLTWRFNDVANTGIDQNTGDVHGDAVQPVPNISASKITAIIRQTSRPVAATPAPTSAPNSGPFGGILGGPSSSAQSDPITGGLGGNQDRDPSDGTFAVSGIKIIGHKAK